MECLANFAMCPDYKYDIELRGGFEDLIIMITPDDNEGDAIFHAARFLIHMMDSKSFFMKIL